MAGVDLPSGLFDAGHRGWVGQQLERVFQGCEVINAHQHGSRPPVAGDGDAVVVLFHAIHHLGELGFHFCEGKHVRHHQNRSHAMGEVDRLPAVPSRRPLVPVRGSPMMTDDADDEIGQYRRRLLAVLVELNDAVQRVLELTAALPHQMLNLESLASESVGAAWRIRTRILEAYAAIVVLEEEMPLLATDLDGTAARWPPSPADVIWRATQVSSDPPGPPGSSEG